MVAWVLCVVALCATSVVADSSNSVGKVDINVLQQRQKELLLLFSHIEEPIHYIKEYHNIASTWSIEKNLNQYSNVTAAAQYATMIKNKWIMRRNVPYAVYEPTNNIETITAFYVLYSAKTYDTFFKTAVYLREIINEGIFVHALSVAIFYRPDTQGITIPPAYEVFPHLFNNADVILSGQRINAQGKNLVDKYPSTYIMDNNVVIKGDVNSWYYTNNKNSDMSYYNNDHSLNAYYYYSNIMYPSWLSSTVVKGVNKDRRGERWWFTMKQLVARYYMERLSNGLGEIPALSNEIAEGYAPGLLHVNGVPVPSRPDNFRLDQAKFADKLEAAKEFERRIWVAIEQGYYITVDINVLQQRQKELLLLFSHIEEPIHYIKEYHNIASTWSIEKNLNQYSNVTAAAQYATMIKNKWIMRRNVPYAVYEPTNNIETITAFYVLYSAKTYDTFFKTAVYLREIINEGIFVHALSVAIFYRPDTQGITIPPAYEVFPHLFNNADVILSGQRINAQGKNLVDKYPSTYIMDNNVVIKGDVNSWYYTNNKNSDMSYYNNDHSLNAYYYYSNIMYPSWLSSTVVKGVNKDRRGERWWFTMKQLVARYYMERLSNGLGEIPALSNEIAEGYAPGLLHVNGVPVPSRPDNFRLDQAKFADKLEAAKEFERRIWVAIEQGYYITPSGEQKSLKNEEAADVLGLLIQANADSPNSYFYKDFLRLYTSIVGNTVYDSAELADGFAPLVAPSAIESYQTALRDPAYYIVMKRVLNLVHHWNMIMKYYTPEELIAPGVKIEKVETDKLVTYLEKTHVNLTNGLPMSSYERKSLADDTSVVAEYSRLNHKDFSIKVNVKSDAAKTVLVKFFLAPKRDSKGNLISIRHNTENYFQFDEFIQELKSGENLIVRDSTSNSWVTKDWMRASELYSQLETGKWMPESSQLIDKFPKNLLLPKGTVNGLEFQLVVWIQDYRSPKVPFGTGFDPATSLGLGSGARYLSDEAFGYPTNRPLYPWQIAAVKNLAFQDVTIYHEA